jgi:hypothetical protein
MHDHVRAVTGLVAAAMFGRQLGDRHLDHGELIGTGVRGSVAGPEHPGECFAGGVEEAEHRWNPNPRLKCGVAPCLRSEWISTSDASTSNMIASGAPPPAHALARAVARAVRNASSTRSSIASNVRQIVGAEATSPNTSG